MYALDKQGLSFKYNNTEVRDFVDILLRLRKDASTTSSQERKRYTTGVFRSYIFPGFNRTVHTYVIRLGNEEMQHKF